MMENDGRIVILTNDRGQMTIRCCKTSWRSHRLKPLNGHFAEVLRQVKASIRAEQVFCSIVTEMKYLPQFKSQSALETVHKENYETSYHRNTAAGNLRRIVSGEQEQLLILMTIECFIEAAHHDKNAENALNAIIGTNPDGQQWIETAAKWHEQRVMHLKRAKKLLRSIVGPELWSQGAALAE